MLGQDKTLQAKGDASKIAFLASMMRDGQLRGEHSLQVKSHNEAVPWAYEVDFFRIKHVRIPITEPNKKFPQLFILFCVVMFLQFFSGFKRLDTSIIAWNTAAILRRGSKSPTETDRISGVFCFRKDFLEADIHLPVVTVVIAIDGLVGWFFEKVLDGNFVCDKPIFIHFPWLPPGAFDMGNIFKCSYARDPEAMEMVVQPVHGILYRHVEIIKRVAFGNLESSPDRWFGIQKDALELIDVFERPPPGNG